MFVIVQENVYLLMHFSFKNYSNLKEEMLHKEEMIHKYIL